MRMRVLFGIAVLLAAGAIGYSQDVPASGPAPDFVLTTPQPTQLKATTFVYQSVQTSIKDSPDQIRRIMTDLTAKIKAGQFTPTAGPIFIFKTLPRGADDVVEMQIGMPAMDKVTPPDGYEIRILDSGPSATSLYQGPYSLLSKAYPQFFEQLMKSGQIPSGELREHILFHEDETSVNNVVMIEMQTAGSKLP